jgi:hypothetical protein
MYFQYIKTIINMRTRVHVSGLTLIRDAVAGAILLPRFEPRALP